jgi:cytidylate kinase
MIIAIDGGAGTGKSSTAKGIAQKLGLHYLDTGAMYRAWTLYNIAHSPGLHSPSSSSPSTGLSDVPDIGPSAPDFFENFEQLLKVPTDPDDQAFYLGDWDITEEIRSQRVTDNVSKFASDPAIRKILIGLQQQIVKSSNNIVLEGRDTTSVVAPEADLKVIIETDLEARAKRRASDGSYIGDLQKRDESDLKVNDFSKNRDNVIIVDNTNLTLQETIDTIIGML